MIKCCEWLGKRLPPVGMHLLSVCVLLVLAAGIGAVSFRMAARCVGGLPAGTTTTFGQYMNRLPAIELAGTPDRTRTAIKACGGAERSEAKVSYDRQVLLIRALFRTVAAFALACACLLGWRVARRTVTKHTGCRMMFGSMVVMAIGILEACALWGIVRNPATVDGWLIGIVTAMTVARWTLVGAIGVFAGAAMIGGLVKLRRKNDPHYPTFSTEAPSVATSGAPLEERGEKLMERHDVRFNYPSEDDVPGKTGVCLSGGGIRAAAFTLGALQGFGPLTDVRYLATVSGGGYTGMAYQLALVARARGYAWGGMKGVEPLGSQQEEFIKANARYLWPRPDSGKVRSSTLIFLKVAFAAIRAMVINAAILVTLLYVVSRPFGWMMRTWIYVEERKGELVRLERWWQSLALVFQALALLFVLGHVAIPWYQKTARKVSGQVVSGVLTTLATGAAAWLIIVVDEHKVGVFDVALPLAWLFVLGGLALWVAWAAATGGRSGGPGVGLALATLGAVKFWVDGAFRGGVGQGIHLHILAAPKVLGWMAMSLLSLALMRIVMTRLVRTKKAMIRAAGLALSGVALAATYVTVALLPQISVQRRALFVGMAFGAALVALFVSIGKVPPPGKKFVGAAVNDGKTLVGVMAALAVIVPAAAGLWELPVPTWPAVPEWPFWLVAAGLLAAASVLVDQREWSPHDFYRERLARAFGPVTDSRGQLVMSDLPTWAAQVEGHPQLLICAAVYDTDRIRPPHTQAFPFVFTDSYVGSRDVGFVDSRDFAAALGRPEEVSLHAAAAISGAAVSPALGAVRFAAFSQVFGVLNLRLGVWMPNPKLVNQMRCHDPGSNELPMAWSNKRQVGYLLRELANRYDTENRFVYVTDGGQFENLGLYELLARRCGCVYAFDASGDKPFSVGGLLHSMALCKERLGIDFGADNGKKVDVDGLDEPEQWKARWESAFLGDLVAKQRGRTDEDSDIPLARSAIAKFQAWYPEEQTHSAIQGPRHATIVFAKARLAMRRTELPPQEFLDLARQYPKFPSDSTADQFMDVAEHGRCRWTITKMSVVWAPGGWGDGRSATGDHLLTEQLGDGDDFVAVWA